MNHEELIERFKINEICAEINNELNGVFVDILNNEFVLGIFSEQSSKNDDSFVVTVEISCDNITPNVDEIKHIQSIVEERLSHNLGKDWKVVEKKFDGVQIIFNEDLVS